MGSRLEKKSDEVRKRIENHAFTTEAGEEYEASTFGGFRDYMRRKKLKLQNLDAVTRAKSSQPQIFKGIVCHVNGYTQPSLNDLHVMIVQHGGGFLQYLDGKTMCTHIIASNLTPKKKEEFRRYRMVKPAWIVDSVREGRLLPWDGYRLLDEGPAQKVLGLDKGMVTSQVNRKSEGYRDQTNASWYTEQLKLQLPANQEIAPSIEQTSTPEHDIEDEEFPMQDIASPFGDELDSMEQHVHPSHSPEKSLPPSVSALETPPPSSPPTEHVSLTHAPSETVPRDVDLESDRAKTAVSQHESLTSGQQADDVDMRTGVDQLSALQQIESVPDDFVVHAVIRNSDVLRATSPSKLAMMTAEEHNALLLSDPNIRKSTVVHPDFLEQYYQESRLHHLSTWKAELKSQLQALAAEKTPSQHARDARSRIEKLPGQRRYIMHVDFDSFFAAVSLKKHPDLADKPCVVAHGGGAGSEIASCNYPARKFGVSNGMWMKRAQDLCPQLKVLPYDFPAYEDASRKFYSAIMATDGIVQSVSIDEALVDISALCISFGASDGVNRAEGAVNREQSKADEIAQGLRAEVLREAGCNVSVGIGGNILLAKIALRKAKPAGQYQLKPEETLDFIGSLEVKSLPGVAWSIGGKLEDIGITFVKDIREVSKERLMSSLGPKTGERIWDYSRGIDRTEVGDQVIRKSVSAEVNWGVRFATNEQVDEFMHGLCGELHQRLIKESVKGRQLTLKVMRRAADAPRDPPKHLGHGKCDTVNKSLQLGVATNDTEIIAKEAVAMIRSFNISPGELRGIGVQMQKLEPVRSAGDGIVAESSQRKLQFKTSSKETTLKSAVIQQAIASDDPIQDSGRMLQTLPNQKPYAPLQNTPSKKRLNTMGTQFVLPTQADPRILAELPDDIRGRLTRQIGSEGEIKDNSAPPESVVLPEQTGRAQSPAVELPAESQLDPDILEALPADVKEEIMSFYKSPRKYKGGQAVLPQSPRKQRTLPPSKQPLKRNRGGGLFPSRSRTGASASDHNTLTQSNFVSRPITRHLPDGDRATTTDTEPDEVDEDFLAALPEDIRGEVLEQQRQARLQRTGGIDLSLHQRPKKRKPIDPEGPLDRILRLPPRPKKATFTARRLSALPDLRNAITAWHEEFRDDGPYSEDLQALCQYLKDVVLDERDMSKGVAVVKWLQWVVDEDDVSTGDVRDAWRAAVENIKDEVQSAVARRGLGIVDFE